jgi:hypothetical protein
LGEAESGSGKTSLGNLLITPEIKRRRKGMATPGRAESVWDLPFLG